MKIAKWFLAVVVLQATILTGQQTVTPQPAQQATAAAPNTTPCTKQAQSHKQGWLEQKARALACKKNPQFCSLPSSPDDALGTPETPKPCPQNPTPKPYAPPATPAPQTGTPKAPAYVCPPRTAPIPNTAYCLTADHKAVDAIPLQQDQPVPTTH